MSILINGRLYECEPAVEAYIKDMEFKNKTMASAFDNVIKHYNDTIVEYERANEKLRALVAKCARRICKQTVDVVAYPTPNLNADRDYIPTLFGYDLRELLGDDWKKQIFGECTE